MRRIRANPAGKNAGDRIARIAAQVLDAPAVFIAGRGEGTKIVLGSYGIEVPDYSPGWSICDRAGACDAIAYVVDVPLDIRFRGHPVLRWAPYIRTLVHQPILNDKNSPIGGITIINPALKWPFKNTTFVALRELSKLARVLVPDPSPTRKSYATRPLTGFQDAALAMLDVAQDKQPKLPNIVQNDGTTSAFLMQTLVLRPAIRNRNDVSYITIRTWRRAIKEHQISALRLLKATQQEAFIDLIAQETVENIVRLLPTQAFDTVVAVPPGHSRSEFGFSEQIAARIAERMTLPYRAALTAPRRAGSSHPRKNTKLQAPEIAVDANLGNVLLIDDVATSGRHIELAVKKLATVSTHVTAIAWIGSH